MTHPKRDDGSDEARQRAIAESRMIRSEDIDVIAAVDAKQLRGSVVKDGNMQTCAYVFEAEVARWRSKRGAVSEPEPQSEGQKC